MRLDLPLPAAVYDELRELQFECDELTMEDDLVDAARRLSRIRQRIADVILASDAAWLRKNKEEKG